MAMSRTLRARPALPRRWRRCVRFWSFKQVNRTRQPIMTSASPRKGERGIIRLAERRALRQQHGALDLKHLLLELIREQVHAARDERGGPLVLHADEMKADDAGAPVVVAR